MLGEVAQRVGILRHRFFSSLKGDGSSFRSWADVIEDAKNGTQRLYGETIFSDADIRKLKAKNIKGQNPKAYSMPNP